MNTLLSWFSGKQEEEEEDFSSDSEMSDMTDSSSLSEDEKIFLVSHLESNVTQSTNLEVEKTSESDGAQLPSLPLTDQPTVIEGEEHLNNAVIEEKDKAVLKVDGNESEETSKERFGEVEDEQEIESPCLELDDVGKSREFNFLQPPLTFGPFPSKDEPGLFQFPLDDGVCESPHFEKGGSSDDDEPLALSSPDPSEEDGGSRLVFYRDILQNEQDRKDHPQRTENKKKKTWRIDYESWVDPNKVKDAFEKRHRIRQKLFE